LAELYGRTYSEADLSQAVGDMSQLGGVRLSRLTGGTAEGVLAADFRTGSGLNFTVLPDRALDICQAEFNGQPLCWRSSTGDVAPPYYEPEGSGWLRGFYGGLLVTCGLRNVGGARTIDGESAGLHGRISYIPARDVCADAAWEDDQYLMWIRGKVQQTAVFGENLLLTRKISARLGEPRLWVEDTVKNLGYRRSVHRILYHCNLGFPVLGEGAELICNALRTDQVQGDPEEAGKGGPFRFEGPTAGYTQRVYMHDLEADEAGYAQAALVNRFFRGKQGIGVYLRYLKHELPHFVEWKMMGQGLYVVGMEPANCRADNRDEEFGTLVYLQPGEQRQYHLEIGVLPSAESIAEYEGKMELRAT